jgi:cardiolipin synthase
VRDEDVIERVDKIAHHDWENSHPLDLTDAGLLADLEDRLGAADLALHADHKKKRA